MTDAEQHFIEQMGVISQRNGSPRISGRILGLLIVRGSAVSLQQISADLKVSKASVSTNARFLKDRGMVRLTTAPGERQDYYEMAPNPFESMLQALSSEMTQAADEIAHTMTHFKSNQSELLERIGQLQNFYQGSASFLADVAQSMAQAESQSQENSQSLSNSSGPVGSKLKATKS